MTSVSTLSALPVQVFLTMCVLLYAAHLCRVIKSYKKVSKGSIIKTSSCLNNFISRPSTSPLIFQPSPVQSSFADFAQYKNTYLSVHLVVVHRPDFMLKLMRCHKPDQRSLQAGSGPRAGLCQPLVYLV